MKTAIFKKYEIHKKLLFLVLAFWLTFTIEWIFRNSFLDAWGFLTNNFSRFAFNYSIVLLTLCPSLIFKKKFFYLTFTTIIWIILSIANSMVMKFRGTPLTGSDLGMLKNGLELAEQYLSKGSIIALVLLLLIIIGLLIVLYIKCPKKKINYKFKYIEKERYVN